MVVRELVQSPEGNLGLKFVPEMTPASAEPLSLPVTPGRGEVSGDLERLSIRAGESLAYGTVADVPHDVRIRLTVRPSEGVEAFGLCVRGEGDYREGNELSIRPNDGHIQFGHPQNGDLDKKQPVQRQMRGDTGAMPPVTDLAGPLTIDLIAKGRILDVCIDNRRTLIGRREGLGGTDVFFFAKGGTVVFERIEICPLVEE